MSASKNEQSERWYSVETPSVFREVRVADYKRPTAEENRALDELHELAERYETSVHRTGYPRG